MEFLDSKEKHGEGIGAALNYLRFSIASESKSPQVTDVYFSRLSAPEPGAPKIVPTGGLWRRGTSLPPCHPFNQKLGVLSAAALLYVPS